MLEMIRDQLMRWFSERRKTAMNSTGLLVPVVIKALQAIQLRARKHRYIHARDRLYEVKSTETFHEYLVDIDQRKCSCRIWQSQGYPCSHAVAVILGCKEDPQLYAETFFFVSIVSINLPWGHSSSFVTYIRFPARHRLFDA